MLRKIRFIVGIAACSLAGIFLLQGYWLFNSYRINAEAFDKTITTIVQSLQRSYLLADMQQLGMPVNDATMNFSSAGRMEKFLLSMNTMADLGEPKEDSTKNATFSVISTLEMQKQGDSVAAKSGLRKNDTVKRMKRTLFIGGSGPKNQLPKLNSSKTRIYNFSEASYGQEELQQLEKVVHAKLDSLMWASDIKTPFALQVKDVMNEKNAYLADSTLFNRLEPKLTDIKIGMLKPFYLDLSLNNDILFIMKKMQWVLLSSVFIIVVTFGAYWYMLRTIFQQKKLSDIKNDFFNNMTHEFKTPIATISLAVEALQQPAIWKNRNQVIAYLDISQHELKRISFMVEKVLKMAAFERNDEELSFQQIDMEQLINQVLSNMKLLLEQKKAKLTTKFSVDLPKIGVDSVHMANVIYNLLDNALKYVRVMPLIAVSCEYITNESVQIKIKDNGIGIPLNFQDKIFEPFFRVPTGNVHNAKGFGLGLSYAAAIIKRHQGSLKVESVPNKGSTFIIVLPLKPIA